jgi:hypothetical protein
MSLLQEEILSYIGIEGPESVATDAVELGAVRRYAQAIMDESADYSEAGGNPRYRGGVAPPIYPAYMFRRALGTTDPLSERAEDPNFDGLVPSSGDGLPEIIPLRGRALLNGGSQIEFFRYARHGERVLQKARYAEIAERQSSKGPMVLVTVEISYRTEEGEPLMNVRKIMIRR